MSCWRARVTALDVSERTRPHRLTDVKLNGSWDAEVSPTLDAVAVRTRDGVRLWDVSGKPRRLGPLIKEALPRPKRTRDGAISEEAALPIRFSPDGRSIAVATSNSVGIWDVGSGRKIARLAGPKGRMI